MKPDDDSRDSFLKAYGIYGAVGIQLAISVVLGAWGGNWADDKLGTTPWLMIVGVILGTAVGFYNLGRIIQSNQK